MGEKAHSINEDRDCVVSEALGRIWDEVYGVTVRYEKEKKREVLKCCNLRTVACTLSSGWELRAQSLAHSDGECITV